MNNFYQHRFLFFIVFMFLSITAFGQISVYTNHDTGNDTSGDGTITSPFKTFHKAYTKVLDGGVIHITGTFTWTDPGEDGDIANYNPNSGYNIAKSITIQGTNPLTDIIQSSSSPNTALNRIFYINNNVTINNITLRHGKLINTFGNAYGGGGIYNFGSALYLNNCIIKDNIVGVNGSNIKTTYGSAIYTVEGTLYIDNCLIDNNKGVFISSGVEGPHDEFYAIDLGGMGYGSLNKLYLTNSTISNNTNGVSVSNVFSGLGVLQYYITNNTFFKNTSTNASFGNALFIDRTGAILTNNTFVENKKGVVVYGSTGDPVYFKNNIVVNNSATDIKLHGVGASVTKIKDNGYNFIGIIKDQLDIEEYTKFVSTGTTTQVNPTNLALSSSLVANPNGPGGVIELGTSSIAIDNGNNTIHGPAGKQVTPPCTDQRGMFIYNSTRDAGAYEYLGQSTNPFSTISITTQPSTVNVEYITGNTASALSVSATGTNLQYQWYSSFSNSTIGGKKITGATSSTYTPSITTDIDSYYYVKINKNGDNCNFVESNISGKISSRANLAPTDIILSNNSIIEENLIGAIIGSFTSLDPNPSDITHTYSLATGIGDNDNSNFSITGSNLATNIRFNYSIKNSYSIRVRSTDTKGLSTEKIFIITIIIIDTDLDGINDSSDNCRNVANTDQADVDLDGFGNLCDTDDDNDGFSDSDEITCGSDPLLASSKPIDTDTDGIPNCIDDNDDGDGCLDTVDAFPLDPNECLDNDTDGIGNNADTDDDNDGFSDSDEITCGSDPLLASSKPIDTDTDGIPNCIDDNDDGDGCLDTVDAFPLDPNECLDNDTDGIGNNADTDDDNDGFSDSDEITCGSDPLLASSKPIDTDTDGIPNCIDDNDDGDGCLDTVDAFPLDPNECLDNDTDGIGNNADTDDDNDGISDSDEITCGSDPLLASSKPIDTDTDGIPNCLDTNDDGDGCLDTVDAFPLDPNECLDNDTDGIGNNADTDDDNDGFSDSDEITCGSNPLLASSKPIDTDTDGIPNCLDTNDDGAQKLHPSGLLTPNSDGMENTWKIVNIEKYSNTLVTVYNKNGQEVFKKAQYKNDWRGNYKNEGELLPAGSYYYIIDINDGKKPITGWLYITY